MINGINKDIEYILNAGNKAPSGENCQPWHFVVRGNTIDVHLLPERDNSAYSWGQRGSYFANGAAIENIVIAATAKGYRANASYFPNQDNEWHVATILLEQDASIYADPLAEYVEKRVTNRKSYTKQPLTDSESKTLSDAVLHSEYGKFAIAEAEVDVVRLGRIGSTNEEVMLANRSLHNFFFSHVNWTKKEDAEKKIGFYIKTLELPPPAVAMFRLIKHWPVMRVFASLGFSRMVAKQNAVINASASAIGALMVDATEPLDFVKIGRTVERLWLTATSLGLSIQPMTGVLFFNLALEGGEVENFSSAEQTLIRNAYQDASKIFNAGDRHIVFMFRIGHGRTPSAQAVRFPLEEVVTIQN